MRGFSLRRIAATGCLLLCFLAACRKETVALRSWRETPSPLIGEPLHAVWFTDAQTGYIAGGRAWESGFLLSTSDGGAHWRIDTSVGVQLEHLMFNAQGDGFACGLFGLALHRPAGDSHWYTFRTDYRRHRACFFPDRQHGVVVSGESFGSGQVRAFGPQDFWRLDTLIEFPAELGDVWFSDKTTVHAVGMGWVMRSDDGGLHWRRLPLTGDFFQSVHFPSPAVGYICGSSGSLLKTTDGGRNWRFLRRAKAVDSRKRRFKALWFASPEKGWLVGEDGLFLRTEDGGENWAKVNEAPDNVNFTDIYAFERMGWAVSDKGQIFYFED